MSLIRVSELHKIAESELPLSLKGVFDDSFLEKTASKYLHESFLKFAITKSYDIFLSHSSADAIAIYGLKIKLKNKDFSVFVDWTEENFADRSNIDAQRADDLRKQMKKCKSLIFVTSDNASESIWMPWELGYFDGYMGKVAIIPLNEEEIDYTEFEGQEYLGIYPYVIEENRDLKLVYPNKRTINFLDWLK